MHQMTILTGPERRRRWSAEDRFRILQAAFSPGAVVADVARQYDVCTTLIYKWRQNARAGAEPSGFAPAVMADEPPLLGPLARSAASGAAAITVDLGQRGRVSIEATASPALVTATLRALRA
jgi:transposase